MGVADVEFTRIAWTARLREPGVRGAQLLAASGFALAQPLFDIGTGLGHGSGREVHDPAPGR